MEIAITENIVNVCMIQNFYSDEVFQGDYEYLYIFLLVIFFIYFVFIICRPTAKAGDTDKMLDFEFNI